MTNKEAYGLWSTSYDQASNKTRDLEGRAFRSLLSAYHFSSVIELGCGTGKNTGWLADHSGHVTAIDFSPEMLNVAREKIQAPNATFLCADLATYWHFAVEKVDLITCSLVLEHIENIDFVFGQAGKRLLPHGLFYVGELHPAKQYEGSKARFKTDSGFITTECFTHHLSEFWRAACENQFSCIRFTEWFDEDDIRIPRIIALLFQRE